MILGVIFVFLLYRQNPEIVIFGAIVFIAWKILSGFGRGKNANPELLLQQNINTQMQNINEGIRSLVGQIALLNLHSRKDAQDMIEENEDFDHYQN